MPNNYKNSNLSDLAKIAQLKNKTEKQKKTQGRKKNSYKTVQMPMTMREDVVEEIREHLKEYGIPFAQFAREAVIYLAKERGYLPKKEKIEQQEQN